MVSKPTFSMGQTVVMAQDEGLDIPDIVMGQVGIITAVHQHENHFSYTVKFADGQTVYCETYHIDKAQTIT